ncbi:MAG: hypothetical protein MZV63_37855 [Marinilabiliales bacterium]|nr:hypothetical protein [Marinilabiliales bacterium]
MEKILYHNCYVFCRICFWLLLFRIPIFTKHYGNRREVSKQAYRSNTALSKYVTAYQRIALTLCFVFHMLARIALNSIENLKQYEKSKAVDRIIAIAVWERKGQTIL